ncbi:MAG: nicotinate-nucleotide adenylyltransferase [Lachnospiraceae bacterium]|nr:nicotinate-nucleotide adenylyltransferase [Lachnospiraceae bacterium]
MEYGRSLQKIGVFGGTFDPFHNGHLAMAKEAVRELSLDRLLVIPAGNPYLKGRISPYGIRFEMADAALRTLSDPRYEISDLEADEEKPTYTYLTLQKLHKEYPESRLFFICGRDVFNGIRNWRSPDRILKEAALAVFRREGSGKEGLPPEEDLKKEAEGLKEIFEGASCVFLDSVIPPVSSTMIRDMISGGKDISGLVPEGVERIIRKKGLYR